MFAPTLLLVLGGCKKVEEIPADLDGVFHFLWENLDAASPEALAEGVVNLDAAMDGATLEEAFDGSITRLSKAEAALVGVTGQDPAEAAGIFLGNVILCDLPMVAEIVTWPEQDALYTGVYDFYSRDYEGEIAPFLAGNPDDLRWTLDYGASVLGASYTAHTDALLRRVDGGEDAPFETAYLARFAAPDPAVFEEGSGKSFEQDYQLEVYWSRRSGETLHAYAMWREADWGSGFTSEDEGVQRILLNNMESWDKDTDKICEEGGPS